MEIDLVKLDLSLFQSLNIAVPKNVERLGTALTRVRAAGEEFVKARDHFQAELLSLSALLPAGELTRKKEQSEKSESAPKRTRRKVETIPVPDYVVKLIKNRERGHFDENTKCQIVAWIQRMLIKGHSTGSIAHSVKLVTTTIKRWLNEAQDAPKLLPTGETEAETSAVPAGVKHGLHAYKRYDCRCDVCRTAKTESSRVYNDAKKKRLAAAAA